MSMGGQKFNGGQAHKFVLNLADITSVVYLLENSSPSISKFATFVWLSL